jgi:murein DD-endopeptidase MepM/ murein hydrolase activator NlpD
MAPATAGPRPPLAQVAGPMLDIERCDGASSATPGRGARLAKPVACTFSTPRGSFGAAPVTPQPPPLETTTDTAKKPPAPGADGTPATTGFAYYSPGELLPQDKGRGRVGDRKIYLPGIIYPLQLQSGLELAPPGRHAHMNSQIWGYGGGGWNGHGAAGGTECDRRNYNPMVQRDNFCEVRGWDMPMCPAGQGHQGQDIRPPACDDDKWSAVAVVDGTITLVTSNTTVVLKGGDGTEYYYLHMHPDSITVEEGNKVKQGQVLGRVSNFMNGGRETTHHLHFQVKQSISIGGSVQRVYVPVFASLIAAYRKSKGLDAGVDDKGQLQVDATYEIGAKPADQPKPPFTLWPVPNVAGFDGRILEPVNLSRAFRATNDKPPSNYAATGLPPSLSVDAKTGIITGKLDAGASRGGAKGVYTVTATATDTNGQSASQSFTITAQPSAPVVVAPLASKTFREGDWVVVTTGSAFADPNLNTLTFSAAGLPVGLSFDAASGKISGKLANGTATAKPDGAYVISITASDGVDGSVSQSFTMLVLPPKPPEPAPVAPPQVLAPIPPAAAFAGQPLAAIDTARYFKAADGDPGALQYVASGLPPGVSMDAQSGQITGALPQSAADGKGEYAITVTAISPAGGNSSQTFLLTVRNQLPTLVTQTVNKSFVEGEVVVINAGSAFSTPPGSVLTFAATGLPAGLAFDAAHGAINGTLSAGSAKAVANGLYTVAVVAQDQRGAKASETFTITVTEPPAPPQPPAVVQAIAPVTVKDGEAFPALAVASSFKAAGTAGSTGPLKFAALGLPGGLSIDEGTGVISGTIATTASKDSPGGNYLVTLFATDAGNGLKATLGLVVTAQPIPVVVPPTPPPTPTPEPPVTPVTPPTPPAPTPTPPPAETQGWWPWLKDKAAGAWGYVTK